MSKEQGLYLVIIIPALNEEESIATVIREIPARIPGIRQIDVVVVDDGSRDNTRKQAEAVGARVISHDRNYGVGKAYSTGLHEALALGADLMVNIDADGQANPADIAKLIQPILSGEAEFVTASRFKDPATLPLMTRSRYWGNLLMSRIISKIVGKKFHDVSCGFRACSREAALRLNLSGRFTYTQETFLELAAKGIHIHEMPMVIRGIRAKGKSRVASNLWKYGRRTMRIIIRAYKDYWPWEFFSSIAIIWFALGLILGGFLILWRIIHHEFSPHIWAGITGGFCCIMGMLCLLMGIIGDMLRRIRLNAEQLLYFQKKQEYAKASSSRRDREQCL